MIKIIKEKPENYTMTCSHCDCKFTYALEDLKKNYYEEFIIKCPCCGVVLYHSNRLKDKGLE